LIRRHKYDASKSETRAVEMLDPGSPRTREKRPGRIAFDGQSLLDLPRPAMQGNLVQAESELRTVASANPNSAQIQTMFGRLYSRKGDAKRARESYGRALQVQGKSEEARAAFRAAAENVERSQRRSATHQQRICKVEQAARQRESHRKILQSKSSSDRR